MSVARREEPLVSDMIRDSDEPSAELFESVRTMSDRSAPGRPSKAYRTALAGGQWVEAAHLLLDEVLPRTGFMAGLLPDGSAHARIMVRVGTVVRPVDSFRDEGHVSLALLEAVARALEQRGPDTIRQ